MVCKAAETVPITNELLSSRTAAARFRKSPIVAMPARACAHWLPRKVIRSVGCEVGLYRHAPVVDSSSLIVTSAIVAFSRRHCRRRPGACGACMCCCPGAEDRAVGSFGAALHANRQNPGLLLILSCCGVEKEALLRHCHAAVTHAGQRSEAALLAASPGSA